MRKVHFTPKYTYPNDGSIRSYSVCGLHAGICDRNFIDTTVVEGRVNCKKCLKILAKKAAEPTRTTTKEQSIIANVSVNEVAVCDFCGEPTMDGKTHCIKCSVLRLI